MNIILLFRSTHKFNWIGLNSILSIITVCLLQTSALAQWNQTAGPEGGEARSVARVGDEIWVASPFGIYTSTDDGASWNIHPQFTFKNCNDLLVSGDSVMVVYASTSLDFTYYFSVSSYDLGQTWNSPVEIFSTYSTQDVAQLNMSGGNVFLTEAWPDDYISNDFGITWEIFSVPVSNYPQIIYFGESDIVLNVYDANVSSYLLYIQNQELNTITLLDSIYNPIPIEGQILIKDEYVFFVIQTIVDTTFSYSIIRSDDYGQNWDTLNTYPGEAYSWVSLSSYDGILYMSYYTDEQNNQVQQWMLSTDNGNSWQNGFIPSVVKIGNNSVLLSTGEALSVDYTGMRRYDPTATNWFQVNTGFRAQRSLLFEHNGYLYSSCDYSNYRSGDGGNTWNALPFPNNRADAYLFMNDTILTVIGNPNELMRSFDNGNTWDTLTTPFNLGASGMYSIEEFNGRIYVTGNDSTYTSDNLGITWLGAIPWIDSDGYPAHGVVKKFNNELYSISSDGSVAKMDSQNQTWTELTQFWSTGAYNGNTLFPVDEALVALGDQFFKYSINGGATWISPTLNGLPTNEFGDPYYPLNVISLQGIWFCSLGRYGVFSSSDMGQNWQPIQSPPPFSAYGGLVVQNNILFSGSYSSSVWRRSGPLSIISGNIYRDLNNNGVKDGTDYDLPEVSVNTVLQPYLATSNPIGNYGLYTDAIGDTLKLMLPSSNCSSNPPYYLISGPASNQNFGLYLDPTINDLSVDLTNVNVFRPGFETILNLTAKNKGGSDVSAELRLVLDSTLTFISAQPAFDAQQGDTLIWNSPILSFLESSSVSILVSTPLSASLGDTVLCYASVNPIYNDVLPNDNQITLTDIFVGSYDPNDKSCSAGEFITLDQVADEELIYTVRFQNTGNYMADNVHINDTLNNFLDLSTFRVISASHAMRHELSGTGIVDFYFDDIFLPDSTANEALSHGFVKYGLKCKPNLSLGNAITNTAYIYFDFNPAIITNKTTTLVSFPIILSTETTHQAITENAIVVYPNPAQEYFTIDARGMDSKNLTISLFDIQGTLLKTEQINSMQTISFSGYPTGVYVGVITDKLTQVKRTFKIVHQ